LRSTAVHLAHSTAAGTLARGGEADPRRRRRGTWPPNPCFRTQARRSTPAQKGNATMTKSRFTPAVLASLAVRLTPRDRKILRAVWHHRVLPSPQLPHLFFDTDTATRKRLLSLHHMGVLERFRPNQPIGAGAAPYHYVLGASGAAVLASEEGIDFAAFGYRRDRALGIAHNQRLTHTVGVNDFFAGLTATDRRQENATLITWWTEQRCAALWGQAARPDGYGRWQ